MPNKKKDSVSAMGFQDSVNNGTAKYQKQQPSPMQEDMMKLNKKLKKNTYSPVAKKATIQEKLKALRTFNY